MPAGGSKGRDRKIWIGGGCGGIRAATTSTPSGGQRPAREPLNMAHRAPLGVFLACIVALSSVHQAVGNVKFVLLHFNDWHSRIEGEDEWHGPCQQWVKDKGQCHGGIARMKTAIDAERSKGLPVIVLNAGDDFIGTHWDYAYKGGAAAVFLNQLNITAATVGNHDFDYGPDRLTQYIKSLNYPIISANLNPNGHEIGNHINQYVITEVGGMKVGICAVGTEATNTNSHPAPAYMEDHFSKGRECVDNLRNDEGVKIIILLSHEGYNADRYIARDTYGVDIVVGGHSHAMLCSGECPAMSWDGGYAHKDEQWGDYPTWMWSDVNHRNIPVVQAGWASRYMGRLEVEFDDNGDLQHASGWPMLMGDWGSANHVSPDPSIEEQIASWKYWE